MGGYKDLLIYRTAVTIFDFTNLFCNRWIEKRSRTFDQMIQAARSGLDSAGGARAGAVGKEVRKHVDNKAKWLYNFAIFGDRG